MTALLVFGVRKSARTNTVMVAFKLAVLVFFIVVAVTSFNGDHFSAFAPHGFSGTVDAAALIFFAYIGFDAVSTSGEEAKNPQRDLPIGIIGSLLIATLLYILVSIVAVGLAPADKLAGSDAPLSDVASRRRRDSTGPANLISFGALVAITSVTLTILYGQTRIFFAMSRDGLLPASSPASARARRPRSRRSSSASSPRSSPRCCRCTEIAELVNIGTLFAFLIVNIGVIVLRRTQPDLERGLPRAVRPGVPAHRRGAVHLPDDAARRSSTWGRFFAVARARARHLLLLRPHALAPAARRGAGRRALGDRRVSRGGGPARV